MVLPGRRDFKIKMSGRERWCATSLMLKPAVSGRSFPAPLLWPGPHPHRLKRGFLKGDGGARTSSGVSIQCPGNLGSAEDDDDLDHNRHSESRMANNMTPATNRNGAACCI